MDPITILALSFSILVIVFWGVSVQKRLDYLEEDLDHVESFLESLEFRKAEEDKE